MITNQYIFLSLGIICIGLLLRYGDLLDSYMLSYIRNLQQKLQPQGFLLTQKIAWLQYIIHGLRCGISVNEILETYVKKDYLDPNSKKESQNILQGKTLSEPSSIILQQAITNGTASLKSLKIIQTILNTQLKCERKKIALSTQARAQIILAILLPAIIFLCMFLLDNKFVLEAIHSDYFSYLLLIILSLNTTAIYWMRAILKNTFIDHNPLKASIEAHFSNFLLFFISYLKAGEDILNSRDKSISHFSPKLAFIQAIKSPEQIRKNAEIQQISLLIEKSEQYGASITEELHEFILDGENKKENRWEACAQKLPLKLLLPLFICVLPASLLIILLPIFPILIHF